MNMAKGGSRWGAGRPGYKVKGEQLQRIDVREFARRGMFTKDGSYTYSWIRNGQRSGSIGITVYRQSAVTLDYTFTSDEQSRVVEELVNLIYTPCNFGGTRPWFGCPRCERQVAVLYMRAGRFACRHCQKVAYSSQAEDQIARLWRKQHRIEAKLGEHWQRPKGMRHRTHEMLLNRLEDVEQRREGAFCVTAMRLFGHTFKDGLAF